MSESANLYSVSMSTHVWKNALKISESFDETTIQKMHFESELLFPFRIFHSKIYHSKTFSGLIVQWHHLKALHMKYNSWSQFFLLIRNGHKTWWNFIFNAPILYHYIIVVWITVFVNISMFIRKAWWNETFTSNFQKKLFFASILCNLKWSKRLC